MNKVVKVTSFIKELWQQSKVHTHPSDWKSQSVATLNFATILILKSTVSYFVQFCHVLFICFFNWAGKRKVSRNVLYQEKQLRPEGITNVPRSLSRGKHENFGFSSNYTGIHEHRITLLEVFFHWEKKDQITIKLTWITLSAGFHSKWHFIYLNYLGFYIFSTLYLWTYHSNEEYPVTLYLLCSLDLTLVSVKYETNMSFQSIDH